MSIRLKLTLWYSAILAATLALFGIALYVFLSFNLYSNVEKELKARASLVKAQIHITPFKMSESNENRYLIQLPPLDMFDAPGVVLQVINDQGEVGDKSSYLMERELPRSEKTLEKARINTPFREKIKFENVNLLIYNQPLFYKNKFIGVLQVATSTDTIINNLTSLQWILTISAMITILLASTLGLFLACKAFSPIEQVIAEVSRIERGADLERRIGYKGPRDEIGRLAETFNGMLSRLQHVYSELEEAYRAQRRFVSDASHELRTPLTTIRGNVDLLEKMWGDKNQYTPLADEDAMELSREAMRDIADEARRMSALVGDLLALARADAGYVMEKQPVELKPLVEEVARRAHFLSRTAEWVVGDLQALEQVWVIGSKDYLQQLLFIFIENGFKYTNEGYVRMDAFRAGNQIGMRFSDTGIGMNKDEIPHIFERFYRADVSRGKTMGTGLGLSIAKWIIDEHQGSIEVATGNGEGTTFVVWLPVLMPESTDLLE